jgi:hypothetical protein
MSINTITLANLQALRLTCTHCRSALIIPLDAHDVPGQCFNCSVKFPAVNILTLLRELHLNKRDLTIGHYDIALEVIDD